MNGKKKIYRICEKCSVIQQIQKKFSIYCSDRENEREKLETRNINLRNSRLFDCNISMFSAFASFFSSHFCSNFFFLCIWLVFVCMITFFSIIYGISISITNTISNMDQPSKNVFFLLFLIRFSVFGLFSCRFYGIFFDWYFSTLLYCVVDGPEWTKKQKKRSVSRPTKRQI